jgi:Tol biopolymer transport system component
VDYGQPAFVYYVAGGTPIQVGGSDSVSIHRWSPDGQELAFKGTGGGLWLIKADGSEQRPLVTEAIDEFAWGPGQRLIVYNTVKTRGLNDLWVMDMDRGEKRQLTVNDPYVELAPTWTPEGSSIIFQRADLQGNEAGIWSVAPDGTGLQQLSSVGTAVQVFAVR